MELRNPERIDKAMDLLTKIWKKYPDTRFNQLVYALEYSYSTKTNTCREEFYVKMEEEGKPFVTFMKSYHYDLFNVEDDDYIEFLEYFLEEG